MEEDLTREAGHEQVKRGLMIRLLHHLCEDYTIQLHTDSKESREKSIFIRAGTLYPEELRHCHHVPAGSQISLPPELLPSSSEKIQRQNLPAICDGRSDEVCAAAIRANYPAG